MGWECHLPFCNRNYHVLVFLQVSSCLKQSPTYFFDVHLAESIGKTRHSKLLSERAIRKPLLMHIDKLYV